MSYILLIIGFIILIKGADLFVSGSSGLAKHFRISPIIIGLTIVAFGTSAPEAAVSITAALNGTGNITVGNVVGSNLINISLIIGVAAVIYPLKVQKATIIKEIPLALLGSVVLLILVLDINLQNHSVNILTRADGLILIAFFIIFLYYIIEMAVKNHSAINNQILEQRNNKIKKHLIFTIIGLAAVTFGGWLVVNKSQEIALALGMSETLVGLTIVAIGTSLPELVTAITAALKKENEIALGNIIGSNIFNTLFILGVSSVITPLVLETKIIFDIIIMIALTLVLLIFSTTHKRKINRFEGILLTIVYLIYLTFIIIRN